MTELQQNAVTLDGHHIHYGIKPGTQGTLLIFNGIGAALELVQPLATALDDIGIVVFDAPGVGRSSTPKLPLRFPGFAKLAAHLLDHLNYGKVDVLGVSWGGALAQQFARDYPKRCRKLILAATSAGNAMVPGKLSVMAKMANPKRYLRRSYMKEIASHIYGGAFVDNPDLAHRHAMKNLGKGKLGYYWQLSAGMCWTSIHWLHQLKQPTLIMAANDDPIIPLVNAKLLLWRIPNAKLEIIKGGGHLFLLTHTSEIAPQIVEFLAADK